MIILAYALGIVAALGLLIAVGGGLILFRKMVCHVTYPRAHTWADGVGKGEIPADFPLSEFENVELRSRFGYGLAAVVRPGADPTAPLVVFVHGISWTWHGMIKYMPTFLKRDWNIVSYDHRAHGNSGGRFKTFGHFEKHDLATVVAWARERFPNARSLCLYGESMGAAVLLQFLGLKTVTPDAVVVDSPFKNLWELSLYHVRQFGIPRGLRRATLCVGDLLARTLAGFSYFKVDPEAGLMATPVPVLLCHSRTDEVIPCFMSEGMAARRAPLAPTFLHLQDGATHTQSIVVNRRAYENNLWDFLVRFMKI